MPVYRIGTVTEILGERPGLQRIRVEIDGATARAYVLTELLPPTQLGHRVVCNTTAVELSLGTGGWHFVQWDLDGDAGVFGGHEHIMKLRYTSLQANLGSAELDSIAYEQSHVSRTPDSAAERLHLIDRPLDGVVVIACSLHSQAAAVLSTIKLIDPGLVTAYVMTDGAGLPLAMSDLMATLRSSGTVEATVTAGHAFGGDSEAVSVPSALGIAAHVHGADIVVVSMGPGVVGTGTKYGTTATEVASILDVSAKRGAIPVLAVRASDGDARERQRGISHHTTTAAELAYCKPFVAPVPTDAAELPGVRCVALDRPLPDVAAAMQQAGVSITTMGRGIGEDPLFFKAAGAAAALSVQLVNQQPG